MRLAAPVLSLTSLASLPLCAATIIVTASTPPPTTATVYVPYSPTAITFTASSCSGTCNWTMTGAPPGDPPFALSPATGTTTTLSGAVPDGCSTFDSNAGPCPNALEPMVSSVSVNVMDSGTNSGAYAWTINVYWNPTQAQFTATQNGYLAQMVSYVGNTLKPSLATGGNLIVANPQFRSLNYDSSAQWAVWIRAMAASGMSVVWIYPDVECYINNRASCMLLYSSTISYAHGLKMSVRLSPGFYNSESCGDAGCPARGIGPPVSTCTSSCSGYSITPTTVPTGYSGAVKIYCVKVSTVGPPADFEWGANTAGTDCSSGGTHLISSSPTLLNSGLSVAFPNVGHYTSGDSWTMTAAQNGLVSACPVTSHAFNQGTSGTYQSGVADWYYCLTATIPALGNSVTNVLLNLLTAPGDVFVPIHEPTTQAQLWGGGVQPVACATGPQTGAVPVLCNGELGSAPTTTGNTCPQDWLTNFWTPFNTSVLIPGNVTVGTTFDYSPEMDTPQQPTGINQTYAAYFSANLPHTVHMGMDLYNWSPGYTTAASCPGTCAPSGGTYPYTINQFQTTSSGGGGHDGIFVQEFGPTAWTVTNSISGLSAPNSLSCAIIGIQSCSWSSFDPNFYAGALSYLASYGADSAAQYASETLAACAPVYPDNGLSIAVIATATGNMSTQHYSSDSQCLASIERAWGRNTISGATVSGSTIH